MVQDTIKSLKRRRSFTNQDEDEQPAASVSDQISRTCAVLLNSIPEQNLQVDIVHALIRLLDDLGTISSIGVLDDIDVNGEQIEVLIFTDVGKGSGVEVEVDNANENDYGVALGTSDRLLMLQSSTFQLLFQLFIMQHCRQPEHDHEQQHQQQQFGADTSRSALPHSGFRMDGEHIAMLLKCTGQLLETCANAKQPLTTAILIMRNKIMACDLLFLLLPEYGIRVDAHGVGKEQWMQLMHLITTSVCVHLEYVGNQAESDSSNDRVLKVMSDVVSSHMVILLRAIFLCPPSPCNSFANDMPNLRSKFVHRLFDCIPNIARGQGLSLDVGRLSGMVLRAIRILFCPDATSLSALSTCRVNEIKMGVDQMMRSVLHHCKVNSLCPPLFSLLIDHYSTLVWFSIDIACKAAFEGKGSQTNEGG